MPGGYRRHLDALPRTHHRHRCPPRSMNSRRFDHLIGAQQGCLLECSYALAFFDLDLLLLLRRLRWLR
jgi:hypothetical protein